MKLNFYQIWYDENSKPNPSSQVKAYDCRNNPEFLRREVAHLIRFYDEVVAKASNDEFFALLSPKFSSKTGLSFDEVDSFIVKNPGYDIYLFNPFPGSVYKYLNVWENAESKHPGIKQLAQDLFDSAGIEFDVDSNSRNNILNTVYCNYWVASKPFLDDFIKFVKLLDNTINNMPDKLSSRYFINTRYNTEASFYPFIFERLISTFLLMNSKYSSKPYIYHYPFPGNHKLTPLEEKFYFSDNRNYFDNWETTNKNSCLIYDGFKIVQNRLQPNVILFKNKATNRLSNSFLKRVYKFLPFDLKSQLEKLDSKHATN